MKQTIDQLQAQFEQDLQSIHSLEKLNDIRLKYFSKKHGLTVKLLKQLGHLTLEEKKQYGALLNKLKQTQQNSLDQLQTQLDQTRLPDFLDLTIPQPPANLGQLHPTTQIIQEINHFFHYYGFSVGEGPEIETVEYNFRKLNLPEGHPATDLQDSLFIKEPNLLLRTQTSSIEARILTQYQPPLRVVAPGVCYRNETTNATNAAYFFQYQGFVVEKSITIQHLKGILTKLHQFLFGKDVKLRFRYKYYPEVSPGMGVDMQCRFCHGKGCSVCKQRGWIEVLGSGMIHYNTLKACGIDPQIYTGFAFGMGLDRLVMSKFGITDIRKLYGGKLAYL